MARTEITYNTLDVTSCLCRNPETPPCASTLHYNMSSEIQYWTQAPSNLRLPRTEISKDYWCISL